MINDEIKEKIITLITKFKKDKARERAEAGIQTHFTVELLKLLGWETGNITINEGQDVKTGKIPDILLQNQDSTLMVIESKDASKKDMLDGRYQTKTFTEQLFGYCKAEGIVWGILTNFIEWRIYSVHREVLYKEKKYAFIDLLWPNANTKDYIDLLSDEGEEFFNRISKFEMIKTKGRFDSDPVYYPKQIEIKEKFFEDLKNWRGELRNYLIQNYKKSYEISFIDLITQKILDRLIFIDYCADNNIITQDRLHATLSSKGNLHNELKKIFVDMDERFNSELFAPNECDNVVITDEVLRPIINGLANIDFNRLSVHVIGEVYENYLGELLRANTAGVKVDKKKKEQKRRSQGIYYTPEFVVNYIIENTLGKVLKKCKTIKEIENVCVLDPACGSGSFLIRAFDEFLKNYERIKPSGLFQFDLRKKILQNNIYGVDLDEKAVEIAKLNLLVKALEGSAGVPLTGRKILPNLKLNIRCGNSLVYGHSSYDNKDLFEGYYKKDITDLEKYRLLFHKEVEDEKREDYFHKIELIEQKLNQKLNTTLDLLFKKIDIIKPINLTVTFPEVFAKGGFNCIIGNPPYIDSELMTTSQPETREYIKNTFTLTKGNWDIYIAFFERAYKLTNTNGYWGFITPDKWISKPFGEALRTETLKNMTELIKVGREVFADAKVDSIISIYSKSKSGTLKVYDYKNDSFSLINSVKKKILKKPYEYDSLLSKNLSIIQKIDNIDKSRRFIFSTENACSTGDAYKLKPFIHDSTNESFDKDKHIKVINTGTIGKYVSRWAYKQMTYLGKKHTRPVLDKKEFFKAFTNSYAEKAGKPKLIIKSLTLLDACIDSEGAVLPGKSTIIAFTKNVDDLQYLAAIINSKLSFFFISQKYSASSYNQGINFTSDMIAELPVIKPTGAEKEKITNFVTKASMLHDKIYNETDFNKIKKFNLDLEVIDQEIDDIIYKMYNITSEEIKIIEELAK